MPQLMKLVWGGRLGTVESWSCSLHGLADDGAGPSVSTIAGIVGASLEGANAPYSNAAYLDFIKLNFVTAADRYVTPAFPVTFDVLPPKHGSMPTLPFQNALVVTLLTAAPRGLASKGRYYIPAGSRSSGPAVDEEGQIPDGVFVETAISQQVTMLNALAGAGFAPQVYSVKGGTGRPVTGIKIGHVYDTQRRRRRSLPEKYTTQNLAG